MPILVTDAVVLHAFDYLESSRILRLMTREAGVQSVIARGARRSRARFGTALDIFASGIAYVSTKPGRDLNTLTSFDVGQTRPELASDLIRLTGAAMLAELVLRGAGTDASPEVFEVLVEGLDSLAVTATPEAPVAGLAGAWRLVSALGFSPTLDACAECSADLEPEIALSFSARAGGAVCAECARRTPTGRSLPSSARHALRAWIDGGAVGAITTPTLRAHQRLLKEFVREHLNPAGLTNAYDLWERAAGLGGVGDSDPRGVPVISDLNAGRRT